MHQKYIKTQNYKDPKLQNTFKGTRMCHPKRCHCGLRMTLNWRQIRINRGRPEPSQSFAYLTADTSEKCWCRASRSWGTLVATGQKSVLRWSAGQSDCSDPYFPHVCTFPHPLPLKAQTPFPSSCCFPTDVLFFC